MRKRKHFVPRDLPSILFLVQLGYLVAFSYIRVMLKTFHIDPPLLDGLGLILYAAIGLYSIGYYIRNTTIFPSHGFSVSLLILYLAVSPLVIAALFRPQHLSIVPQYVGYAFSAAFYTAMGFLFLRQRNDHRLILVFWFVAFLFTIPAIWEMRSNGLGAETAINRSGFHIPLGDLFLFVSLIAIATSQTMIVRIGIYTLSVVALLAIGSRTSLYVFAPTLLLIVVVEKGAATRWIALASASLAAWFLSPLAAILLLDSQLRETRMFQFLASPMLNTSWRARNVALQSGIDDIRLNPLFGSFGGQVEQFGSFGMYIHSYLELWRQFGLVPFVAFLILLYRTLSVPLSSKGQRARFPVFLILAVPLVAQIALSRSYGYSYVFFLFGITSAILVSTHGASGWAARARGGVVSSRPRPATRK